MKSVQDLNALEKHMKSSSEQHRVDALLATLDYGDAGLHLVIQALDDPSQSVRETANLLLTNSQSEQAKQALWDYLPYRHMRSLCTLHFLDEDWLLCDAYYTFKIDYVAFTPNRDALVTYSDQNSTAYLWNSRTGEIRGEFGAASWEDGGHVVLSPGGAYLIYNFQHVLHGTTVREKVQGGYLDCSTGFVILESEPTALAVKSDHTLIVGSHPRYTDPMSVYQLPTNPKRFGAQDLEILHRLQSHTSPVTSLLLSPDETLLLSQGRDRQNDFHHLWDTQTWQLLRTYETSSEWVADCLATRPDGQVLASGDRNGAATVWNLRTDEVLYVLPGKAPTVMSVDGRVLICRSDVGGLLVWDLATNQKICTLAEGIHKIAPLALSPDRQFLVILVENNIQVWA